MWAIWIYRMLNIEYGVNIIVDSDVDGIVPVDSEQLAGREK